MRLKSVSTVAAAAAIRLETTARMGMAVFQPSGSWKVKRNIRAKT